MIILELGPGPHKQSADAIGLDLKVFPGVQIIADFREGLPCRSSCADVILAYSVVEHLPAAVEFIRDCHRVLRPGGELRIKAPHPRDRNIWDDPTHFRPYTCESFRFFVAGHPKNYYFDFAFRELREEFDFTGRGAWGRRPHLAALIRFLRVPYLRSAYQPVYVLVK